MSTDLITKLDIYINYPGHCEEAFLFYEQHLGGNITMMNVHPHPPYKFSKGMEETHYACNNRNWRNPC